MLYGMYLQTPRGASEVSKVVGADDELLRCVWSNHPDHDRDCHACIPAAVVFDAWRRENEEFGTPEGFFYFSWNGAVWLAYGLRDRRVRGVYCPAHCAERTANLLRPEQPSGVEDLLRGGFPSPLPPH